MEKGWRSPHDMIRKHPDSPGSEAALMMVILERQEGKITWEGDRTMRKQVNPNELYHTACKARSVVFPVL